MLLFSNLALMFWFTKWTDSCVLGVHPLPFPIMWCHAHSHRGRSLTFAVTLPEQRSFFSVRLFTSLSGFLSVPVSQTNAHRGPWGTNFIAHSRCLIYVHCCPPNFSKVMQGWEYVRAAKRAKVEVSYVSWVREQLQKSESSWQLRQLLLREKMATEFDITLLREHLSLGPPSSLCFSTLQYWGLGSPPFPVKLLVAVSCSGSLKTQLNDSLSSDSWNNATMPPRSQTTCKCAPLCLGQMVQAPTEFFIPNATAM